MKRILTEFILCLTLLLPISGAMAGSTIELIDRHLYGPGPFPDQKLETAWIRDLELTGFLEGVVKGFNNLGEEPNVSGEAKQGKTVDGKMSDGTLINESIDMGNAVIMNGQFNLLLGAVFGGTNEGDTFFYLDDDMNWWIKDDIAIDPGFETGVVKINDFTFSTSARTIPYSLQTELGYPGGTNQIGSTESGRIALGRLGDDNADGYLDGVFNAIGRFPLEAIFLPGAPFVQLFEFKSDIPVTPLDAALLTTAGARSALKNIRVLQEKNRKHKDIQLLMDHAVERMALAANHLEKFVECGVNCDAVSGISSAISGYLSSRDASNIKKQKELESLVDNAFSILKTLHTRG